MESRKLFCISVICGIILFAGYHFASGAIPRLINYQGKLTDHAGDPVQDGSYSLTFKIYDDSTGGSPLWSETQSGVMVTNGIFSIVLGDTTPINLSFDADYWLEVMVGAETITPRRQLTSVGYSFRAQKADTAEYAIDAPLPPHDHNDMYYTEAELNTSDGNPPNQGSNRVSWENLGDVPAGFADGIDHVGGGSNWTVTGSVLYTNSFWSIARGGAGNVVSNVSTIVNLGVSSTTDEAYATVSGGHSNTASAAWATVGGGTGNTADGDYSTVSGGDNNTANGGASTIGGGEWNTTDSVYCTVGGGQTNHAIGPRSTIAGGDDNTATGEYSAIGGGIGNDVGYRATVGGGQMNNAGYTGTIGGGMNNTTSDKYSTVGGGRDNTASGEQSTVSGGGYNVASGDYSTVSGGEYNTASGNCSWVGGCKNAALGDYSFAVGSGAIANHEGAFVWADASGGELQSTEPNQFLIRAAGGTKVYSNADQTAGVTIHAGASAWAVNSDRNLKENFTPVDGQELLEKIAALPISEWNYKTQSEKIKHIGPVAQDFYAIFGLGDDNVTISTIDPAGIALAGIKELINENRELKEIVEQLKQDIEELKNR